MQAVFDYLDGLALLDFIVVGAVLLMGASLIVPDLIGSWRRRRALRLLAAFRSDHPDRTPLAAPSTSSPSPVGRARQDLLQQRGASDGVTSTREVAQSSLWRPRADFHPSTRNERVTQGRRAISRKE